MKYKYPCLWVPSSEGARILLSLTISGGSGALNVVDPLIDNRNLFAFTDFPFLNNKCNLKTKNMNFIWLYYNFFNGNYITMSDVSYFVWDIYIIKKPPWLDIHRVYSNEVNKPQETYCKSINIY